jgi:hypothetical protein
MVLEKPDIHMERNKIRPLFYTTHTKKTPQNVRSQTIKVLGKNVGDKLHKVNLQWFLENSTKGKSN